MIKKIMIATLSTLISLNALAAEEIFSGEVPLVWQPIITLSGGPGWSTPGLDQINYNGGLVPVIPNQHFIPSFDSVTVGAGEIFFGLQRIAFPGVTGQLGLGIAGVLDPEISGRVEEVGVANVYHYSYNVEHARLELKGKLIGNTYRLQPFVSGSFGVAMNNSHNWALTSEDPILFPPFYYQPASNVAFAYSLGAGLQFIVSPHWQVGAGYEFVDLGKSGLGPDVATTIPGITLTHLYVNQAVFSLSFVY